ncbi:MAG TPA: hypothetical protein VGV86_06415 [Acidimicrobiales bacterium]|nr:hypothetical protein [Acidimicrobiales bacterium]
MVLGAPDVVGTTAGAAIGVVVVVTKTVVLDANGTATLLVVGASTSARMVLGGSGDPRPTANAVAATALSAATAAVTFHTLCEFPLSVGTAHRLPLAKWSSTSLTSSFSDLLGLISPQIGKGESGPTARAMSDRT